MINFSSVECYAKLHAYPFHLFSDAKYKECARHKDVSVTRTHSLGRVPKLTWDL